MPHLFGFALLIYYYITIYVFLQQILGIFCADNSKGVKIERYANFYVRNDIAIPIKRVYNEEESSRTQGGLVMRAFEQHKKSERTLLNGFWQFATDAEDRGAAESWYMGLPASETVSVPSVIVYAVYPE